MWISDDDLVDGLRTLHIVIVVFAGLAKAGLNEIAITSSHIFPTEKQAQYIFRHWLLLQLHPVYLFFRAYSCRRLAISAGVVRRDYWPILGFFAGVCYLQ